MKLYFSPGACSLSPHIALYEAGLKFEAVQVNLKDKTYKGGDFKKINPKGAVPALEMENGEILTEGSAIVQYIADQKPDLKLIPKWGTPERYHCQEWLNFVATDIHKSFSPLWSEQTPETFKTTVRENLGRRFDFLTNHFKSNTFLMGNQYTVADAYLFTVLRWTAHLKFDMSKWSGLMGYAERIKTRPATAAALKAEGLTK